MTTSINRGAKASVPFSITDANAGLGGKRVTWSVSTPEGVRVLKKVGGLPGSTADITITTQSASLITGFVNILVADYASMPADEYYATLWVDDGAGNDLCVSDGGFDILTINHTSSRTP